MLFIEILLKFKNIKTGFCLALAGICIVFPYRYVIIKDGYYSDYQDMNGWPVILGRIVHLSINWYILCVYLESPTNKIHTRMAKQVSKNNTILMRIFVNNTIVK